MTLAIKQQIVKNPAGKIKYWKPNPSGREHFHIGIWLDGDSTELDKVLRVDYRLHQSFKKPNRSSSNRSNKFSITIWTWGMFTIDVEVHRRDGSVERMQYYLSYDLPPDDGTNYVAVEA